MPLFVPSPTRLRPWFARSLLSACLVFSTASVWAQRDDYSEVNRLILAGQYGLALERTNQYLNSKPRDPQMRFLRGVIQSEMGRPQEAIETFTRLTQDFPELPEPYNNLAVLHASQNQLDKARNALEMAIRTNPSYATAHENLGDVYARLASQAYSRALQIDGAASAVAPKLNLIRSLFANDASAVVAAAPTRAPTVPVAPPPEPTPPPPPTAAVPSPVPAAPAPASKPVAPVAPSVESESAAVSAAVQDWAAAWARKDMGAYFGAYARAFVPPNGMGRAQWEQQRRERIVPRDQIEVEVSNLNVNLAGDRAIATFRQRYRSGSVSANSLKTLELVRNGGRWLISRENVGS